MSGVDEAEVFKRVTAVIVKVLDVDEADVKMESDLLKDLGADSIDRMTLDTAVVRQHPCERQTVVEIVPHRLRAIQIEFFATFPQHQQAGDVIDLGIHHHHRRNTGVTNGASGL